MLRADLVDARLSGNKYFKLLPNLALAHELQCDTLLSFGGPWSNHLHALAAAGQQYGLRTIGIVRGESPGKLTPCLQDARHWGMDLHFVSRSDYARRHEPHWHLQLLHRFGPHLLIPEGGANKAGILGCQQLIPESHDFTHILLACGTGATLAGVVSKSKVPVHGIQVLKGEGYLQQEVQRLLALAGVSATVPWHMHDEFHLGGYARFPAELLTFMARCEHETGIPLEPVYGARLLWATQELVRRNVFPPGARLLLVHGGGLQGRRSLLQ